MNIGVYSRIKILKDFEYWGVPKDYADPMYNYLVHGFDPGSFFTSVLANDFAGAVRHSHPSNSMESLKHLCGWMNECLPKQLWGNYDKVNIWLLKTDQERREFLEKERIIFTEKEETWKTLQGADTWEPMLF